MENQLEEQEFTGQKPLWPFLKRIFAYSRQYPRYLWLLVISATGVALLDSAYPILWAAYIDGLVAPLAQQPPAQRAAQMAAGFWRYGGLYLGVILVQVVGIWAFIVAAGRLMEHVIYDLRKLMFDNLQRLSFSFYDRSAVGWLLARLSSDTDRVAEVISWGLLELVWGISMIAASMLAMFWIDWRLALAVVLTIPVLLLLSVRLRMLILKYSRQARKMNSEMTANFNENINGLEVNKTTGQEERATAQFRQMSDRMRQFSYKSFFYSAMYLPLVVMTGSVAAAAVIYLGGNLALAQTGGISVGILAAFFGYARHIFEPILDITRFYATAQSSISAGERIFSLIDEQPAITDRPGVTDYGPLRGEIEFRQVDFHYVADKPILRGFNLRIRAGEQVALVGPTGEGKSTLASLVCRFYEPTGGSLLIEGTDYRERTLHSLRRQLGVILQTPHLFAGTLRDNLRYGHAQATDQEIAQVLQLVGGEDFIPRLDEQVGEEGGNLSVGEKQLISFARTMLKDPKIVVMDEATSSVDTLAEARIQRGMAQLVRGRTAIIIAHRLSTIRNADRILVIRQGQILEEGTHQALLERQGAYYALYTRQGSPQADT
ncbi:MAG: ABC transporter ATP-binding protein/permease [Bernardetiaceae bacterium]|jgi:ATP-binding cassette subfamily B protein|nr:ABC transporter ATP-binding protein/permease [Bernardetiaceae bacterium]